MRTRYKLLIVFLLFNIIVQSACVAACGSFLPGAVLLALEAVLLAVLFLVNRLVRSSNWFKGLHADPNHERYPDNIWYRKHDERNFDLINLGSNSAKYAFDYTDEPVRAMNWSAGTQTLIDDYKLVRNFHSILKKNGIVIITVMPFTSVNKKTGLMDAFRFWGSVDYTQTAPEYQKKCRWLERFPILFGIPAIKTVLKVMLGKDRPRTNAADADTNPMSDADLKKHAAALMDSWKKEFSIDSFEQPLTAKNREGRKIRIGVMRDMLDFLAEREYRAVLVIPPVSSFLKEYFTAAFLETYIYSYLKQVDRNVPILDFMAERDFEDKDLYFNSYYLNRHGAKLFTHRVITELQQMNML